MDQVDVNDMSDEERLSLANEVATNIRESLPREIYAGYFTSESKIPYKATSFREVLIHRVSDLADVSITQLDEGKRVPAFVTIRSVVETSAMMYWLWKKTQDFLDNEDEGQYDEFLMRGMLGSRDGTTHHESFNILSAIDHLNREFEGLRKMYDSLCEYAHPNWAGVMGAYSEVNEESLTLYLGKDRASPPLVYGLGPLIGGLFIFQEYYDEMGKVLEVINSLYYENHKSY